MAKKKEPKYKAGDCVKISVIGYGGSVLTVSDVKWNGYTYMYNFEENNLRCGESYLYKP